MDKDVSHDQTVTHQRGLTSERFHATQRGSQMSHIREVSRETERITDVPEVSQTSPVM